VKLSRNDFPVAHAAASLHVRQGEQYMKQLVAAVAALFACASALAQEWPAKPIRVVIPNAAGSVSEAIFRTMSPSLESRLGQRFIVDSRPGADGAIGTTEVIRSAPDGYTLLLAPTANYAVTPHLFKTHNYEPLTSLEPISMIAEAPLLTIVNTSVPAKNLKELVDYVRANPGKYNYGSPGTGSPAHLTGAFFSQMAGNGLVHIPYKGTVPMITAMLANDVQMAFPTLTGVIGQMKAGKLRALAVMAKERLPEVPDVPTAVEAGYPQLVSTNWWVLSAPKGTSPKIIDRLYNEFRTTLALPDVRKRVGELGHVTVGLSPADTAAFIKAESARYRTVVEKGNIRIEQ
jgi:tripartite-type tricarboxylate transporter receptor subunit TctC